MTSPIKNQPVVLSLKPRWAEAILNGSKTIEIRRRFRLGENLAQRAFVYTTSPVKALEGETRITAVRQMPIEDIKRHWLHHTGVSQSELEAYLGDLGYGTLIYLDSPRRYDRSLPLVELRERHGFTAPQSFAYASDSLLAEVGRAL